MKILKTVFLTLLATSLFISCKKEYSYESGINSLVSGTWQFVNSSVQYSGNIDSAFIDDISGTKVLTLEGISLAGEENFRIRLYTTDSFTTTGYLASLSQSDFDYFTSSKTIFKGDVLAGEFTVTITSLSNNKITGTFSGVAEDSTGAKTQITLGAFSSAIDLSNNGNGSNTSSIGTLGANPDSCTPVTISGTYTAGVPLSASNTVQVQVNVTKPGTFFIATNSVNGVNFLQSGTFTGTGVQSVTLIGNGTPQSQGVQYFSVTYGTSNCIFQINFLPGTAPTGDYFPTTISSFWAYGLEAGSSSDSILAQVISYAPTINGNVFTSFVTESIPASGNPDTSYYRKSANDYIAFIDVSNIFQFDEPVTGEYIFLNDAAAATTVTRSPDFNGTIGGVPATGYIEVTILEKGVTASVGALNFTDVIKVQYVYYLTEAPGVPQATEERWFARGVGLIYDSLDDIIVYDIGRYTVL